LRRRLTGLAFAGLVLGVFVLFGPKMPRDQAVRFSLGGRAADVRELGVRYEHANARELTDEAVREVSFRYPRGDAPRTVRHEPRLADGDYVLEIEVVTQESRATVKRNVSLAGAAITVDLEAAVPARDLATKDGGATP